MSNTDYDIFNKVFGLIEESALGRAIELVKQFVAAHPYLMYDDGIDAVDEDYRRMLDYMRMGYTDPEREHVYRKLLHRVYIFTADLRMAYRTQHERMFIDAARRSQQHSFTHDRIKAEMDSFVADVAMLEFEQESVRGEKETAIYSRHQEFMSLLFDDILVSRQWKGADADFFTGLLLSPVTEQTDAALIISAVTLSCISEFDISKFSVLVNVYKQSTSETLRQRALVGWLLSMNDGKYMLDEQKRVIDEARITEDDAREIADLQKQMVFCMNAEKDNETIQRDIMPTLIRNNNLNITRDGIIEKDDDPMEDILAPDAADRRMEEMESSLQSMINMQKAGSDVYFGGFSQMKRFPFFYTLSNWFTPFYIKHPDLRQAFGKLENSRMMSALLSRGPFCDSDKYSFAIAMATVIDRIPENMREMLGGADNITMPGMIEVEQSSAAYIRRMYLQDLYRFFRLYPQRGSVADPFSANRYVVAASQLLGDTPLRAFFADLCSFFHKHHDGKALGLMLAGYDNPADAACMRMWAVYESVYVGNPVEAVRRYRLLLDIEPENSGAVSALARAYMECGDYDSAIIQYERLVTGDSCGKSISLNYSVALIKKGRYDDAVALLYRLDYENPDDVNVIRLLAWALMELGRMEQSRKEYGRLLGHPKHNATDSLNAGYCCWFMNDITGAIAHFHDFLSSGKDRSIDEEFNNDFATLQNHGLSITDIRLMTDIVRNF